MTTARLSWHLTSIIDRYSVGLRRHLQLIEAERSRIREQSLTEKPGQGFIEPKFRILAPAGCRSGAEGQAAIMLTRMHNAAQRNMIARRCWFSCRAPKSPGVNVSAQGAPRFIGLEGLGDLSRYRRPTSAAFAVRHLDRRSVVSGNIFNSNGIHVAVVNGGGRLRPRRPKTLRSKRDQHL